MTEVVGFSVRTWKLLRLCPVSCHVLVWPPRHTHLINHQIFLAIFRSVLCSFNKPDWSLFARCCSVCLCASVKRVAPAHTNLFKVSSGDTSASVSWPLQRSANIILDKFGFWSLKNIVIHTDFQNETTRTVQHIYSKDGYKGYRL